MWNPLFFRLLQLLSYLRIRQIFYLDGPFRFSFLTVLFNVPKSHLHSQWHKYIYSEKVFNIFYPRKLLKYNLSLSTSTQPYKYNSYQSNFGMTFHFKSCWSGGRKNRLKICYLSTFLQTIQSRTSVDATELNAGMTVMITLYVLSKRHL